MSLASFTEIKFSKMDIKKLNIFSQKRSQINNTNNPFASPIHIYSTISGGDLGI